MLPFLSTVGCDLVIARVCGAYGLPWSDALPASGLQLLKPFHGKSTLRVSAERRRIDATSLHAGALGITEQHYLPAAADGRLGAQLQME